MRLITVADDGLFQAVSLAGKLGRVGTLVDRQEDRYDDRPDDPEAAFSYALTLLAALPSADSTIAMSGYFGAASAVLDEIATARPDHWLACYLRARSRGLLCRSHPVLDASVAGELALAVDELDELAERQSTVAWQPYFACTFLLSAHLIHLLGQVTVAPDTADRIAALVEGAARHPARAVSFGPLGAVLSEPFIALHDLAAPHRPVLAELMARTFPNQPLVQAALARRAVA